MIGPATNDRTGHKSSTSEGPPAKCRRLFQESDAASASKIERQFPNIQIIPNPYNDGFAAGVNRGAGRAEGRYLLLLNPATVVSRGLVHTLAH